MQSDIVVASYLGGASGILAGLIVGGVVIVTGLCFVVGLALVADLNQAIKVIHQRDTPAR